MAKRGDKNWTDNWRGTNKQTVVKKEVQAYTKVGNTFKPSQRLAPGTPGIYIDSLSQSHLKVAFEINENSQNIIVYVHIDSLVKPGTLNNISLTPKSFGLSSRSYLTPSSYVSSVVNSIVKKGNNNNYSLELLDYLFELIAYAKNSYFNFEDISTTNFPWNLINKDFSEVVLPIACIYRHNEVLKSIKNVNFSGSHITIPRENEPLYDFELYIPKRKLRYKFSTKAGSGNTNVVKPEFIIKTVRPSNTTAYQALNLLHTKTMITGPIYVWKLLSNEIDDIQIKNYERYYKSQSYSTTKLNNINSIWNNFLDTHFKNYNKNNITYGMIRFKCEQLIENKSQKDTNLNKELSNIFSEFYNKTRIIFIRMEVSEGNLTPKITASQQNTSFSTLFLRSLNTTNQLKHKMGYQIDF